MGPNFALLFHQTSGCATGVLLLPDDFSEQDLEANFDFYEPMTVHESSCHPAFIPFWLPSWTGGESIGDDADVRLDLDDYNAEAYQGLHITSMAGTWMSVVEGFGGFVC